jgi:hypothetical protein
VPATPIDVAVVTRFRINGERNESRWLIRSPEPAVGKHNMNVLPTLESPQFLRKVQSFRDANYIHIVVRPNFPVTCDGDGFADCEEGIIFDGFKGTQVIFDAGIVLEDLHSPMVYDNVGSLLNF